MYKVMKKCSQGAIGLAAMVALTGNAEAGGFGVREQSASLMGAAFAGAAAGVDLSSAFWNPAAFGIAQNGLSSQSSYSLIVGDTTLENGSANVGIGGAASTDIDKIGYLSSSYFAYRLNDKTVLGLSVSAPFGLATEADDFGFVGRFHGRAAEMLTLNVSPTLAYEIAPGVQVGAGLQLEYMKLKYWTAAPTPVIGGPFGANNHVKLDLDDTVGVGFTAGILLTSMAGTSIGLGFKSKINHDLEGSFKVTGTPVGNPASAELDTPEMVTLSFTHALSPQMRAMGTVEWTNWSRISRIPIIGVTNGVLDANWEDGWFVSGGLEYDYTSDLTFRGGVAWEKSPIREPSQRLSVLPDSDRVWLTAGASYRYSEWTTFDFSYAHVFFDDEHLTRDTLNESGLIYDADVDNSANIFSVGMKSKLDWLLSGQ